MPILVEVNVADALLGPSPLVPIVTSNTLLVVLFHPPTVVANLTAVTPGAVTNIFRLWGLYGPGGLVLFIDMAVGSGFPVIGVALPSKY